MVRWTCYFSGRVQGVGFRYTAHNIAIKFPVTGYVRNLPDGRVEMVMEGEKENLQAVLDRVKESMEDNIQRATIDESNANGQFNGFVIRP